MYEKVHPNLALLLLLVHTEVDCRERSIITCYYTPLLIGATSTHSSPGHESPESELLVHVWAWVWMDIATNIPLIVTTPTQPFSLVWTAPISWKSFSLIHEFFLLLLLFSISTINSSSSSLLFVSGLDNCSSEVYRMYSRWASVVISLDFSSPESRSSMVHSFISSSAVRNTMWVFSSNPLKLILPAC